MILNGQSRSCAQAPRWSECTPRPAHRRRRHARLKLLELKLGLELRQGREIDALQADTGHVELDELMPGTARQQFLRRLYHAGNAGWRCSRHRHLDATFKERPQHVELGNAGTA